MASTLDHKRRSKQTERGAPPHVAAVVDERALKAAQKDPRVRNFLAEADAYVARLDQDGRNR